MEESQEQVRMSRTRTRQTDRRIERKVRSDY